MQELIAQITPAWEKFCGSSKEETCRLCKSSEKILDAYTKGDADDTRKRTVGILTGVLSIIKSLDVQNLDEDFEERMEEIIERRESK